MAQMKTDQQILHKSER